jgi:flagellar biosynthesis protein FlhG
MTASPSRPSLIAVASGKGGVGKTWLAITLADALARMDRRTLLFDGDLGLANVDIQLGLTPPHDLATVLAGRVSFADAVLRPPGAGFDILAGRSGSGSLSSIDAARLDRVLGLLRDAAARYDHVLLDLGAGIDRPTRTLAAAADRLLVLATEEPTSLTDAYAVLKLHAADGAREAARVVVNQAASRAAGERVYETLRRACATFLGHAPPLAGIVRRDERVPEAVRRQMLLLTRSPGSPAASDVEAVARALE